MNILFIINCPLSIIPTPRYILLLSGYLGHHIPIFQHSKKKTKNKKQETKNKKQKTILIPVIQHSIIPSPQLVYNNFKFLLLFFISLI